MKEIKRRIIIPKAEAEEIKKLLSIEPKSESECFGEDGIMLYTANFGNDIEADVKLCGVQYREGESNLPWTEAVLFDHGSEVCCTEVDEDLFGEWEFEYDNIRYVAEVVAES